MKKKLADIEWIGGGILLPMHITGEGEPFQPKALLWMGADDGLILGSTVNKPDELLSTACESLQITIKAPNEGRPHAPTRIRVADPELADTLRRGYPEIEIICAPTPELDDVFAHMHEISELKPTYLMPGTEPEAVASFFRAAAGLFRAQPWTIIQSSLSITSEQLGLDSAVLAVIGQQGDSYGFLLFSDLENFEHYLELAQAMRNDEYSEAPPHFVLNFECGAELPPELRKEIALHQWEVKSADAYPWLIMMDGGVRSPTPHEITIGEAISLALTDFSAETALPLVWKKGVPISHTVSVNTYQGEIEVTLVAPYHTSIKLDPDLDLIAALAKFTTLDGHEVRLKALEEELMRRFSSSPEAIGLTEIQFSDLIMDFAANYFGGTIATLSPSQLHEIVFDIIPRKVSIDASEARMIIEELRAFYKYLRRAYKLKQAKACLQALGGPAIRTLKAALSDSSNFGVAKSFIMSGRAAGFDMNNQADINTWMQVRNDMLLQTPAKTPTLKRGAKAKKKGKRKAARKARKKNR